MKEIVIYTIVFTIIFCAYPFYRLIKESIAESKIPKNGRPLDNEDIDAYTARLKELLKETELDYNNGIESAESSINFYKKQLKSIETYSQSKI